MKRVKTVILGAGLSGTYAGYLLTKSGDDDFIILEARDRMGGRIETFNSIFDLGPTWFWPEMQPALSRLVETLDLETFDQYDTGDLLFEIDPHIPPRRTNGYHSSPQSKRFIGGVSQLVSALASQIKPEKILLNSLAKSIAIDDGQIIVTSQPRNNQQHSLFSAEQVLLALPPRLAIETLKFSPALPQELSNQWHQTSTWMASHAKYIAIYDQPFWRQSGLSGSAQSRIGPMVEIHDASMPEENAALFGFIGLDAKTRKTLGKDQLTHLCRQQLVRLFGDKAKQINADFLKDWSQETLTATPADLYASHSHSPAPSFTVPLGDWKNKLFGIGSEWSSQFPGYLAGSIDAVEKALLRSSTDQKRKAPDAG
ncbi:MAG: amine oxidase [Oceanospirillales bacterium]|nr:MAG: amine oxidase [Oceanospirillales bacterium]